MIPAAREWARERLFVLRRDPLPGQEQTREREQYNAALADVAKALGLEEEASDGAIRDWLHGRCRLRALHGHLRGVAEGAPGRERTPVMESR